MSDNFSYSLLRTLKILGSGRSDVASLDALVGRTVQSIWIGEDESTMVIKTDDGDLNLEVEGDCCSVSWFADFTGVDTLLGQKVLKVEDVDLPDYNRDDGRCRQEEDQVYGYRFTTERGYADLVFRNSSNGYYGGWMSVSETPPEGKCIPITADWSA